MWESENYYKHYSRIYNKNYDRFLQFNRKSVLRKVFNLDVISNHLLLLFKRKANLNRMLMIHSTKHNENISILDIGGAQVITFSPIGVIYFSQSQ
jgi:hypothetical protein